MGKTCKNCEKKFEREYGDIGYIAHSNITGSYNMAIFVSRFKEATTDLERLEVIYDKLDLSTKLHWDFISDAFDCIVHGLKFDWVEDLEDTESYEGSYKSYPDVASFMEKFKDFVRIEHNKHVTEEINKVKSKIEGELSYLEEQLIK